MVDLSNADRYTKGIRGPQYAGAETRGRNSRVVTGFGIRSNVATEWRRPGHGGSHVIFSAHGVREIVSVPAKRPIKPVYIKQFVALVDAAGDIRTK